VLGVLCLETGVSKVDDRAVVPLPLPRQGSIAPLVRNWLATFSRRRSAPERTFIPASGLDGAVRSTQSAGTNARPAAAGRRQGRVAQKGRVDATDPQRGKGAAPAGADDRCGCAASQGVSPSFLRSLAGRAGQGPSVKSVKSVIPHLDGPRFGAYARARRNGADGKSPTSLIRLITIRCRRASRRQLGIARAARGGPWHRSLAGDHRASTTRLQRRDCGRRHIRRPRSDAE